MLQGLMVSHYRERAAINVAMKPHYAEDNCQAFPFQMGIVRSAAESDLEAKAPMGAAHSADKTLSMMPSLPRRSSSISTFARRAHGACLGLQNFGRTWVNINLGGGTLNGAPFLLEEVSVAVEKFL